MVSVRNRLQGPFLVLAAIQGLSAGCSDDDTKGVSTPVTANAGTGAPATAGASAANGAVPTWHKDIAPLVAKKCTGCHQDGAIAPFALTDYKSAKGWAPLMAHATEAGTMPPFLARESDNCTPKLKWQQDTRLSDDEKGLIKRWSDGGALEGNPADAQDLAPPKAVKLEREDVVLTIPKPITVEGNKDIHTCVVLDPKFEDKTFVTSRLITAGNTSVLHHVVSYVILPGKNTDGSEQTKDQLNEAVKAFKGVGAGDSYDCFGGPALGSIQTEMLDSWAPGGLPNSAPPDSGQPVSKNALVLLDMHYHPTGAPETDADTKLSLTVTHETPKLISKSILLGLADISQLNQEVMDTPAGTLKIKKQAGEDKVSFTIPANAKDYIAESTWTWKLPQGSIRVYGMGTHMHYVGRDMVIKLEHKTPLASETASECLIDTPNWDFNWQRGYGYEGDYEQLPEMRDGDTLRMTCQYDNTMDNSFVRQALADRKMSEPVDVTLGEDTLNEMCLGAFGIVYPNADYYK